MSNIQKSIYFLKQFPDKHFLTITNQENNLPVGAGKIFLQDIPNEDLASYIKFHLGPISKPTLVWVELRKENGTSSVKKDSCAIQVNPENQPETIEEKPMVNNPIPAVTEYHPQHLGNPNIFGHNAFGLGLPDLMRMNTDSAMLTEVRSQLEAAKETIKELTHEKRKLELESVENKAKIATAEQQKELAVLLATANQKGFFDGDGFQKLLDKTPEMIEKIASMRNLQAADATGLGNPDYSEAQREFIDYMVENLSDDQVKALAGICFYMRKPEFQKELTELLDRQS